VELVAEYEKGQEHELNKIVRADPEENLEGHVQKKTIGRSIPFKVEELGTSPRRLKGTFMSLEYTKGWISLRKRQRNEKRKNH